MVETVELMPVYIIHPYKGLDGNYEENLQKINNICSTIIKTMPGILPISPVHSLGFFLDEKQDPKARKKALKYCLELQGAVGKLKGENWVFGEYYLSEGSLGEIQNALRLNMPIKYGKIIAEFPLDHHIRLNDFYEFHAQFCMGV
ncbi:MAG: hypothetical protein JM58_09105 [Peptococcaceae bacterium BICA1-8]|nr:MAG: hypothetical protein JM58_09105 [Peptococcaceae bacterium BICA1-8]